MSLSNTAVPKYYGRFRDAVLRGEIPVCNEISMEMNRIDALIRDPGMYYDDTALDGYIEFCEGELVLPDGTDLKLLDTFKLWAEQLFSWFYFETVTVPVTNDDGYGVHYVRRRKKRRLTHVQYLIIARSCAKTLYDTSLQSYVLVCDTTTTDQFTVAPTMMQAEEVMEPFKTAINRARGPLFKFLTYGSINNTTGSRLKRPKLCSTKEGIVNFLTNSKLVIKPLSIDKLQGSRVKLATIDEWLSGDLRENPFVAIEQGAAKNEDYIIVATSSEGTIRNGVGDSIKMELESILRGEYRNPHVSIWYYKLDDIKEVSNPNMWIKACPTIGQTVSYETYQLEVERAEQNPSVRNDILAKRFGIPCEGFTYFFTFEETKPHRPHEFWQMPCSLGMDLSRGDDFCAFTFLFPLSDGRFGVKSRCYITQKTFDLLPIATYQKYQEFMNEGSLMIMEGVVLDMMDVYDDMDQFIEDMRYDVRCVGYDPYNAKAYIERWCAENSEYGVEKVIQGAKTESVPLGELKKLSESRMLIFDQAIVSYTMGNCIVLEDTNGNRKLHKKHADQKIDCIAALMDAWVSYKINSDMLI